MKHMIFPNAHDEASVVSLRHNYVLIVNSKTAGTTLKSVAARLENEPLAKWRRGAAADEPAQRNENWLRTPTLADLPAAALNEVILGDRFFKFTTVRHPYARCWSAWVDKVLGHHPEFVENFGNLNWFPSINLKAADLSESFEAFVSSLARDPGLLGADRHWAPQTAVLQSEVFPYDFIGKTEELTRTVEAWSRATGLPVAAELETVGRRNARSLPLPDSWLSDQCWSDLERIYEGDLKAFGYEHGAHGNSSDESEWLRRASELLSGMREGVQTLAVRQRAGWQRTRKGTARGFRRLAARRQWSSSPRQ